MSSHHVITGAIECPLASLGHNTPSLDQSYHHPLSTSPLDPQAYQMLRKSQESPILNLDSDKIRYTVGKRIVGCQQHQTTTTTPPRHASTPQKQQNEQNNFLSRRDLQQQQKIKRNNQTYCTPIDSILPSYHQVTTACVQRQPSFDDAVVAIGLHHEITDVERFFLGDKMASLIIDSAIGNNNNNNGNTSSSSNTSSTARKTTSTTTPSKTKTNTKKTTNNRSSLNDDVDRIENADRYFLDQQDDDGSGYNNNHYYSIPAGQVDISSSVGGYSPNLRRRASSPDTSGSDRYFLDRLRGSPAFVSRNAKLTSIKSADAVRYNNNNNNNNQQQTYIDSPRLGGRISPSLDQGYHTLSTPSPPSSGQQLTIWNNNNVIKKVNPRPGQGFNRLPNDLVIRIFELLDSSDLCNLTQVCKRFETLVWSPILWRHIIIRGENRCGDKALRTIFRRLCGQTRNGLCPTVERVMLSEGSKVSDKGIQLLSRRCPGLTHLQLQNSTSVTNQALFDLVTKCTNLQHLDITGCYQITTVDLNPALQPTRKLLLQYLDLTDCVSLNDVGLKIVVKNCPLLVYLYLRRCVQITDAGLKFVQAYCLNIKEISVSDCTNITDLGLYELAKLGANLRYLSVAKCERVSDAGIKVIGRKCYKLRYLNARGCEAVSDDSINILARACTRLRALDVGKCDISDAGLRALAECCPNLKKLSLKNCDMITDRGLQYIAYCCRGLQFLNIQDCQISIEGYKSVKKYCRRCTIEHTNPGFC